MYKNWMCCLVIIALIGFTGCKKKGPDDMPKLYPCTITVTMGNSPVDNALIYLSPKSETQQKWYASGFTDAGGVCSVKTISEYKGAAEGEYTVIITKEIVDPEWKADPNNLTPPVNVSAIPLQYSDAKETPLSVTVQKETNNFNLELEPFKSGSYARYKIFPGR
ncbi:MAG: hypothetical protein Q4G68_05265 [Planctomycetia bacterium]|nr:hypothetical protein [Planctomycetia bacterium]